MWSIFFVSFDKFEILFTWKTSLIRNITKLDGMMAIRMIAKVSLHISDNEHANIGEAIRIYSFTDFNSIYWSYFIHQISADYGSNDISKWIKFQHKINYYQLTMYSKDKWWSMSVAVFFRCLNVKCPESCTSFWLCFWKRGVFLTSNHFSYKESYHFSTVENQKA